MLVSLPYDRKTQGQDVAAGESKKGDLAAE